VETILQVGRDVFPRSAAHHPIHKLATHVVVEEGYGIGLGSCHAVLAATQLKYGKALEEILATVNEDFGWEFMRDLRVDEYPTL